MPIYNVLLYYYSTHSKFANEIDFSLQITPKAYAQRKIMVSVSWKRYQYMYYITKSDFAHEFCVIPDTVNHKGMI